MEMSAAVAGVVIANDVDYKRCQLMVHQVKRLQSPICAVVNHDANCFPNLFNPFNSNPASISNSANPSNSNPSNLSNLANPSNPPTAQAPPGVPEEAGEHLMYDRVLADVPCSGDGTMRKHYEMWARWSPWLGIGMHPYLILLLFYSLRIYSLAILHFYHLHLSCTLLALSSLAFSGKFLSPI